MEKEKAQEGPLLFYPVIVDIFRRVVDSLPATGL
jgi:hypothetical protein